MKNITTIILAAGKSKRFNSQKSKVLHEIADRPLIDYVFSIAQNISKEKVVIVCNKENIEFFNKKFNKCKIVLQNKPKGTADAVYSTKKYVLYGDVPLIKESSIKRLIIRSKKSKNTRSILAFNTKNPYGYGRVEVKGKKIIRVTEEFKANAVSEQIIRVSKKVPVIETRACFPGWLVFAAAATIGALPIPDSFEKSPRATPKRMVCASVAPANPPVAAVPLKACSKINSTPKLNWGKLLSITIEAPIK